MKRLTRYNSTFLILVGSLLLIPLVIHAYIGTFSRYHADDYCTAAKLRQLGFFASQVDWYKNWSGRFSLTFLMNLTQIIGPGLTPFLTAMLLAIWLAVLTFAINRTFRLVGFGLSLPLSFLIGALILYATLDSTPDIYQSIYWQTGMLTYAVPLVILTAYVAWISSRNDNRHQGLSRGVALVISGLITFVAGGFSETYVTMQTASLVVFIIIKLIFDRSDRSPRMALFVAGLVGSIAAMVFILLAPGNAVRQSLMPPQPDIPRLVGWSLRHSLAFSAKSVLGAPATALISLLLPAVLAFIWTRADEQSQAFDSIKTRRWTTYLISIPIVTLLMIIAGVVPSVYATSAYPAERALSTAQYVLSTGMVTWGFFAGTALRQQKKLVLGGVIVAKTIMIGLLGICVLISAQKSITFVPHAQTYARLWDQRDQALQLAFRQGLTDVSATSLPHMGGLAEIGKDPTEWINQCVAGSYGLGRVVSK